MHGDTTYLGRYLGTEYVLAVPDSSATKHPVSLHLSNASDGNSALQVYGVLLHVASSIDGLPGKGLVLSALSHPK